MCHGRLTRKNPPIFILPPEGGTRSWYDIWQAQRCGQMALQMQLTVNRMSVYMLLSSIRRESIQSQAVLDRITAVGLRIS